MYQGNSFDHWEEVDKTLFYILFAEQYKFNNLPDEFKLSINNGLDYPRTCIEFEIGYYNEFNEYKKMINVLNEINNMYELLKEW